MYVKHRIKKFLLNQSKLSRFAGFILHHFNNLTNYLIIRYMFGIEVGKQRSKINGKDITTLKCPFCSVLFQDMILGSSLLDSLLSTRYLTSLHWLDGCWLLFDSVFITITEKKEFQWSTGYVTKPRVFFQWCITSLKNPLWLKVGWVLKNSGNSLDDWHWDFPIWTWESWENWV